MGPLVGRIEWCKGIDWDNIDRLLEEGDESKVDEDNDGEVDVVEENPWLRNGVMLSF